MEMRATEEGKSPERMGDLSGLVGLEMGFGGKLNLGRQEVVVGVAGFQDQPAA